MSRLQILADHVILAEGWRRRGIAMLAGATGALTLAPVGLWPLLAVPVCVAIWLIDGATGATRLQAARQAALDGWWWGFGYHVAGLWWLGLAFLVEADRFAWALPFGVIAFPAVLGLFTAAAFGAASLLWRQSPRRIILFAVILSAAEFLRGNLFTGFPWNSFGMALAENAYLAQSASLVGLYGLTLIALLAAAAPAALVSEHPRAWIWPGAAAGCIMLMAGFGVWRLPSQPSPTVPNVKLRLVQPNLQQDAKFHPENGAAILERYLTLSDRATGPRTLGLQDSTHVIWPESAFPFLLGREPKALERIAASLPEAVTLITGAARAGENLLPGEAGTPIYNSIQVVTRQGGIVASADKTHLVPFGEYLPAIFADLIRAVGLKEFVAIPGGFSAGARRTNLQIRGLPPAAPLICYEAIFPGTVIPEGARAGFLLNLTNDGWFGRSSGPHQHAAQARLRAIEEGMPLVRVANTGISMVTDGFGRILARLSLGEEGVLDSPLPRSRPPTVFSTVGNLPFFGALIFLGGFALLRDETKGKLAFTPDSRHSRKRRKPRSTKKSS